MQARLDLVIVSKALRLRGEEGANSPHPDQQLRNPSHNTRERSGARQEGNGADRWPRRIPHWRSPGTPNKRGAPPQVEVTTKADGLSGVCKDGRGKGVKSAGTHTYAATGRSLTRE